MFLIDVSILFYHCPDCDLNHLLHLPFSVHHPRKTTELHNVDSVARGDHDFR